MPETEPDKQEINSSLIREKKIEKVSHLRSENAFNEFENIYHVGKIIGQGAFGVVNLVEHKTTKQLYACKTLKKKLGATSFYEQQEREVSIMKAVQHDNILQLYEVFENSQKIGLVMELCHGGELVQAVRKSSYCSDKTIRTIISQLTNAVTYLHRNKIIHRDIKPENILLKYDIAEHDYYIKLADFGLACYSDNANGVDNIAGTPMYMAPEIIKHLGYNHTCDVWSIGVMLYLLLCQYEKEVERAVHEMITLGKIEYPEKYWGPIDSRGICSLNAAKNLCELTLRFDPAMRISAGEIANHPWLLNESGSNTNAKANANVLDLMRSYNAERRLKKGMLAILAFVRWQNLYRNSDKARTAISELDISDEAITSPFSETKKAEVKKEKPNDKKKEKPKNTAKMKDTPGHASPSPISNLSDKSKTVKPNMMNYIQDRLNNVSHVGKDKRADNYLIVDNGTSGKAKRTSTPIFIQSHWSEGVTFPRPDLSTLTADNNAAINCPNLMPNLVNWNNSTIWPYGAAPTADGSPIVVPNNLNILISNYSLQQGVYGYITIPSNTTLIFDDSSITLNTLGITLNGKLLVGSETCRYKSNILINLYGNITAQAFPPEPFVKGIYVSGGTLEIHSQVYAPTWTRLSTTAQNGSTIIYIQDAVNWIPNQEIMITTTVLKDSLESHQNEVRTILSVQLASQYGTSVTAITLNSPLQYTHYGGTEYQAEVVLLSRNVVVQGNLTLSEMNSLNNRTYTCRGDTGSGTSIRPCGAPNGFGGHIYISDNGIGKLTGVELFHMGQTNVMGRYPFHVHMLGNYGAHSYLKYSAIRSSFFRCVSIHGTNNFTLSNNVGYDITGHCYYLEDGVEEYNTLEFNFAGFVHFLGNITDPTMFYTQTLNTVYYDPVNLIVPSDVSASGFYITNPHNIFVGNAASGGWSGFAFPALYSAAGLSRGVIINPSTRPTLVFDGNSAHSTGYWWQNAGAFYLGGFYQEVDPVTGAASYNPGRMVGNGFNMCISNPNSTNCISNAWMRFTNTKAFLANRGIMHWGNRQELIRYEAHDCGKAANMFGQVWVNQMLAICRTRNVLPMYNDCPTGKNQWWNCAGRDTSYWSEYTGFEWYDVGQTHILTNTTFRNCTTNWNGCIPQTGMNGTQSCLGTAWTFLTHSDQFVPEQMQATANINYQLCDPAKLWRFRQTAHVTVSGRLQNWKDTDGTASIKSGPQKMGSAWANKWWMLNPNECTGTSTQMNMWVCPSTSSDGTNITSGSLILEVSQMDQQTIGNTQCGNGNFISCPPVAYATHLLRNENLTSSGLKVEVNAKITGPIDPRLGGGWYVRYLNGAPTNITINNIQLEPNVTHILAFPYPTGTQFNIKYNAAGWCRPWTRLTVCQSNFTQTFSYQDFLTLGHGYGAAYFFDTNINVLYVSVVQQIDGQLGTNGTFNRNQDLSPYRFTRDGITLPLVTGNSFIQIQANCPGISGVLYCPLLDDFDMVRTAIPSSTMNGPGPILGNSTNPYAVSTTDANAIHSGSSTITSFALASFLVLSVYIF
ncbi:Fibrocystin-L [Boothiomyces sp. JEL0866]|nr:Fibrocystin-L [Boothiomyces sp. JEL0866]